MTTTIENGRKTTETGRGNSNTVSPVMVERYLQGANYPLDKQKLINVAKKNNAPEEVLNEMERLANKTYNSPIDVSKEMGQGKNNQGRYNKDKESRERDMDQGKDRQGRSDKDSESKERGMDEETCRQGSYDRDSKSDEREMGQGRGEQSRRGRGDSKSEED